MPPVNSAATKTDLAELRDELKGDFSELKGDLAELRTETKADIAELRTETKADIANLVALIGELYKTIKTDLTEIEASLSRQITSAMEHARGWFRGLDDKVKAVDDSRTTATNDLRTELVQHRNDTIVHRTPRASRRR